MIRMLLNPAVLIFLIPIVAICCHTLIKSQKMRYEHEERLAKMNGSIDFEEEIETV